LITRLARFFTIQRVFIKYALEDLLLTHSKWHSLRHFSRLVPTRYFHKEERSLPRGQRIRLALQELGPVFVKLGQVLSTRRDLLPDDIGDELALLQDQVPPFPASVARAEIEAALGKPIDELFKSFEDTPLASASVAQVHCVEMHDGSQAVIKVLRPDIQPIIERDLSLMYLLADICRSALRDGKRMKPREVVADYDHTIHNELDLIQEASNAVVMRTNHKEYPHLYVPEIYWDYTRRNVLLMERIEGIPIRDVAAMHAINMDMTLLAERAVEIFYTQIFKHNFFHADMHPGNIFVSREHPNNPQYIAVDFGIVGSLTEEDQRYLGENILAFFRRDYRRVAQLHVDSGWVPPGTRVSEFESAVRAVCEPIFEKPLAEISFGQVLLQLFQTARRFEMEVQPQLVLLQKTLLNIEGLGRQLYPQLDLWATAKPFLEDWMKERQSPKHLAKKIIDQAPQILEAMPAMPMLVHQYLQEAPHRAKYAQVDHASLKQTIAGAALVIAASVVLASAMISHQGFFLKALSLIPLVIGIVLLRLGMRRPNR
jgi:ubiquinone biosynthesis protein